jgi:hypothetical protein
MLIDETEEQQPGEQGVTIYSKWAILGFSILSSPLVGGILLMLNLRSTGQKKEGNIVLFFAIAYQFLQGILLSYIAKVMGIAPNDPALFQNPKIIICLFIINIIGGGILAEYFFKKYFPYNDYVHKSIKNPLLIVILIGLAVILF